MEMSVILWKSVWAQIGAEGQGPYREDVKVGQILMDEIVFRQTGLF